MTLPIAVLGRGRWDGARLCQTKLFVDVDVDGEGKKGKEREKGQADGRGRRDADVCGSDIPLLGPRLEMSINAKLTPGLEFH